MYRFFAIAVSLLLVSSATAMGTNKTEFVSGDGLLWSDFGQSVDFVVDASQLDPNAPSGFFDASFFSFPSHLIMTLESTELDSVDVDRRHGEVTGSAFVVDSRTGFEGIVEFRAVVEDARGRKQGREQNDDMMVTVYLPSGTEIFAGPVISGDVELGTRR